MARAMGPFPGYRDARCSGVAKPVAKDNVAPMQEVIELHRARVARHPGERRVRLPEGGSGAGAGRARSTLGKRHGYRNAQVTVLAPTGTIGFLMDCDTTGIEPDIALVKYKLLAGGGMLKIVNQTVKPALEKLGYNSEEIERIIAHIDTFDTIEDVTDSDGSKISVRPEAGAHRDLRLRVQAAPRRAVARLHGAHADDGRGAAVPERRDLQDGEHAGDGHGGRDHEHLHRRLAARPEGDRHLPRRLEAFRAAEHEEDEGHGRRRRSDAGRSTCMVERPELQSAHPRTRGGTRTRCRPSASRSAIACRTRACR